MYSDASVTHADVRNIVADTAGEVQTALNAVDAAQQLQIDKLTRKVNYLIGGTVISTILSAIVIAVKFL
jgi:hypothetical protein